MFKNFLYTGAQSKFVLNVAQTFSTRMFMYAVSVASTVLTARALGPEGRGIFAVALAVGTIGYQVGNIGFITTNTYFASRDRTALPYLFGNSLVIALVAGGLLSLAAGLAFSIFPGAAPLVGTIRVLALGYIPLGIAYYLLLNILPGIGEIKSFNFVEAVNRVLSVIFICLVLLFGLVKPGYVFGAVIAALGSSVVLVMAILVRRLNTLPAPSLSRFLKMAPYGFKAYFSALFVFLILRVDLLMVKQLLGEGPAGLYSISSALAELLCTLPLVTGTLLFPKLSSMDCDVEKRKLTLKVCITMGLIVSATCGAATLAAGPFIRLIFGEAFLPAVPAFVWLMPRVIFMTVSIFLINYFSSAGMTPVAVYSPALALIVNIALNIKLIPAMGLIGASISSDIALGLVFLICAVHFKLIKTGGGQGHQKYSYD
ncbi:MAG: oligosaccharide flippase family protein [Desulfocucumaceae bacterium]